MFHSLLSFESISYKVNLIGKSFALHWGTKKKVRVCHIEGVMHES